MRHESRGTKQGSTHGTSCPSHYRWVGDVGWSPSEKAVRLKKQDRRWGNPTPILPVPQIGGREHEMHKTI